MADIRHYTDDVETHPSNFEGLKITMDWLNRKSEASIDIDRISFDGPYGKAIRDRMLNGTSGGVGVFEGMKHRIEVGPIGNPAGVFNGYLDFTDNPEFFGECGIDVSVKKEQGTDWLNEVAAGFTFRSLESKDYTGTGKILNSDFFDVPYVINYIPDGVQLILLAISTYVMTKELVENIKALADRISDLTDAATPVVGVSVGFGGGQVTAYDIGNIILAALKLIAQIAYLAAIVFALVKLTEQIINELMPAKRYHKAMAVDTLFIRACQHLGLQFKSTLIDELSKSKRHVTMPRKNHKGGERPSFAGPEWRETGVPGAGSPIDTFAGLIRTYKAYYNADYKIVDGVFHFERRDKFRTQSSYVIPATFTDQENKQNRNGFNTSEMVANYNINYRYDGQDQNTLDNTNGLAFQAQTSPKNTDNPKLTNLKGLKEIRIPFALPVRKNKLTVIEEIVKAFATLADAITGQLGNPQGLSGKIQNRIGAMHLSSHFTGAPKMIVLQGGNLAKDQRELLGAENLWNKYHFINSFAPIERGGVLYHNQYKTFKEQQIGFCFEDFVSLLGNNLVVTENGENAEVEKLVWEGWKNEATIDYRVNVLYDNNFEVTFSS